MPLHLFNLWLQRLDRWRPSRLVAQDVAPSRRILCTELEDRTLFSAAPIDPALIGGDGAGGAPPDPTTMAPSPVLTSDATASGDEPDSAAQPAAGGESQHSTGAARELVFVDAALENLNGLLDALSARSANHEIDVVVLDASRDGIEQVSQALANYSGLSAVHFLTQGEPGAIKLGDTWLTRDSLTGRAGEISQWHGALQTGGDLLFYGCDLAANEAGRDLAAGLAALTGDDIVASPENLAQAASGIGDLAHVDISVNTENAPDPHQIDVVLIDSHLADVEVLRSAAAPGSQVFLYDSYSQSANNVLGDVVSWAVASDSEIHSISIISHGGPGAFALGGQWLSSATLDQTAGNWQQLGQVLMVGANIDLYGCDVAATGSDGQQLIDRLSLLTGATVFASSNVTGHGGDWQLEAVSAGGEYLQITRSLNVAALGEYGFALVNAAPTLNASKTPVLASVNEDAAAPVGAVGTLVSSLVDFASPSGQVDNVTDPDAGALLGMAVIGADTTNGTWWLSTNNGANWVSLGSTVLSNTNAGLVAADANTRIYFQPNANFNGTITAALTFRAWDQTTGINGTLADVSTNGGATAFSSTTDTINITVNAVNDAPVLSGANNLTSIAEDNVTSGGTLVSTIISGKITDVDSGAATGIAVTSVDNTNGAWQYTTNGGANWTAFGSPSASNARLLTSNASTSVRFVPNSEWSGTVSGGITFRAWDQSSGTAGSTADVSVNGGTTAFSSTTASADITVTVVNDAPVATADAYTVNEDGSVSQNWWNTSWTRRSQITLSGNTFSGATNLTDFPVLIKLNSGNIDYSLTQNNGQDLRFFDSDGTPLAYEVESWNESGNSYVWVKVPVIDTSGSDSIVMYYGNASAVAGETPTSVWNSNFSAVYHLDDPGTTAVDSTVNANAGTAAGGPAVGTGQIGGDLTFDGVNDYVNLGANRSFVDGASAATISLWVNPTTVSGSYSLLSTSTNNGGAPTANSRFAVEQSGANVHLVVRSDDSTVMTITTTTNPLSVGTWKYVSAVVDVANDTVLIYVDGVLQATTGTVSLPNAAFSSSPSASTGLGAQDDGSSNFFSGQIDEARIAKVGQSAAWIKASYLTQSNTFVAIGAASSAPATGGVMSNDSDVDNALVSAALISGPSHAASFTFNSDGTFTYTSVANYAGADSFTYRINDGTSNSSTVTAAITVNSINDAPSGANKTVTTNEDTAYTFTAADFGLSDTSDSPANALLAVKISTLPGVGSLKNNGVAVTAGQFISAADINSNKLVFTPVADSNGASYASFTFQVQDDGGTTSGGIDLDPTPRTMTINLTVVNDVPVRTAGSPAAISVNEDSANSTAVTLGMGSLTYGVGGGSDESGQTLTYKVTSIPSFVTLWLADGTTQVTANTTVTLAQLQGLKYKTVADSTGTGNLTWTVQDSGGTANGGVDTLTENLSLTVSSVNDVPVRTAGSPAAISVNEDSANSTAVTLGMGALTYGVGGGADESGQSLTYKVTSIPTFVTLWLADGTTQVTANTTVTLAQLQGLKYKTVANSNGAANLTWTVQDSGGTANGGVDTLTENLSLTVNAVNDVPVRTAGSPAAISVNEDSANSTAVTLGMGALTYGVGGGADEAGQTLTYTVTSIPAFVTVWLTDGTTQVTANTTITLAQLQGLKYKTVADSTGTGNLTWTVQDSGGTANGGVDTLTENLSLTVNAVNDAPVLSGASNLAAINEDDSTNSGTLVSDLIAGQITDVDSGALTGIAVTAVVNTNGAWQYTTNGGSNWTAFGSPSGASSRLLTSNASTRVRFVPNSNWNGTVSNGITFRAWDQSTGTAGSTANTTTNGGTTAYSSATASSSITVNALNDAPVLSGANNLANINEGNTNSSGTLISTLISGRITDVDTGAVNGMAVTAVDNTNGDWQFTTNSGANWTSFGTPSAAASRLLANNASTLVRFVPNANWSGTVTGGLTFRAWDQTTGTAGSTADTSTNGGTTAFSAATASSNIIVNALPVVTTTSGTLAYTENDTAKVVDSTLTVSDANSANLTGATVSISGNFASGQDVLGFTNQLGITGSWNATTGVLTLTGNTTVANYQTALRSITYYNQRDNPSTLTRTISFVANDGAGVGAAATRNISLTAANDAPFANNDSGRLTFDGTDDYVSIPGSSSLQMTNSVTLEAWIKRDASANAELMIINKEGEYEVEVTSNGTLQWAFANTNPGWAWHSTNYQVPVGEWTHVAVTYNNGAINSYVNGTLVDSYNGSGVIGDAYPVLNELRIGGRSNNPSGKYFQGEIDEVRVWNVARSQAEIQANLTQQPVGNEVGLVGYWRLDETSGNVVSDLSSQGNHGTLGGGNAAQAPARITYVTNEDTPLVVSAVSGVLSNDADPEGSALSAILVSGPSHGSLLLNSDGSFTYTPDANWTGSDSFSYKANDGTLDSNVATVQITVNAVSDAPTLANGSLAAVLEETTNPSGQTVATIFSGQFADADAGASFSGIAVVGNSANASTEGSWEYSTNGGGNWFNVGVVGDGSTALALSTSTLVRFVPVANFAGAPTALIVRGIDDTYVGGFSTTSGSETRVNIDTASNGGSTSIAGATSNLGTVITAVNDQPVRTAGTVNNLAVLEDSGLTSLGLGGLTYGVGGGADEAGQTLTYTVTSIPAASLGTIVLADGVTAVSASSTYTLAQLRGMQFLAAANATGGPATFGWTIADNGGTANGGVDSLSESLTISVGAVNDQPVRTAGTVNNLAVAEDSGLTSLGLGGLTYGVGGGADEAGQTLTYTVTSIPAASLGTIVLADGVTAVSASSTYTLAQLRGMQFLAAANATGGPATFGWTIVDDGGTANGGVDTLSESLTVTVGAVNDQPARTAGTVNNLAVLEDSGLTSLGLGGLTYGVGGGADEAGQTLTYTVTSIPAASLGTIVLADGLTAVSASSTYTLAQLRGMQFLAAANATGGPATFGWTIADDGGTANGGVDTLSESLTVTVGAVNDQPVRTAGTVSNLAVAEDSGLTSLGLGGLTYGVGGGADEAGQTLTYTVTSIPAASLGTIVLADGLTAVSASSTYTLAQLRGMQFLAAANATGGPATFGWTIADDGGTASGGVDTLSESLTVTVGAVNDQPVRTAGTVNNLAVLEDSGLTSLGLGGLTYGVGGGADELGQTLTYTVTSIPAASLGTIVLADGLTAVSASSTYTLAQLRGMQFLAAANATGGPATFGWTIVDDGGTASGGVDTLSESLTVTVGAVNDQPVRTAGTVSNLAVAEDSGLTSLGLGGLTYGVGGGADEAGQTLTYTVTSVPAASLGQIVLADGLTAVSASSTYTLAELRGMQFLAAANATGGPATFGWTIADDGGTANGGVDTLSESLTVSVGAVNDQPVRTAGTVNNLAVAEDSGLTSLGLGGLTYGVGGGADEAGQTLTYTVTSIPAASLGQIVLADGLTAVSVSSTYTLAQLRGMQFLAAANATGGPATFSWTIVDDGGTASGGVDTLSESLTVSVGAVNDQPVRTAGTVNNLAVAEDSGLTSLGLGGLTYGVGGGADEAGQTLTYTVTSVPAASLGQIVLADGVTAVSASSTYTLAQLRGMQFLAAANATGGPATFGWTIADDGGTANGGVDTLSESLTVTVGAVNDQPVRTAGTVNNLAVAEDSGLTSLGLGGLTYGVGGGADEAGQTLTYTVTSIPAASLGQIVLADGLTAVSASSAYTLAQLRGMQFLAAANATGGPATFGWTIVDDGGTANGGVDTLAESLTVTVGAVNDQPVRTAGTVNNLAVLEDSGLTSLGLGGLTYGVGGGADEAGQTLTYTVTSIPAASLGTIVLADGVTAVSASSTYTLAQLRGMQFLAAANATGGPAIFSWTIVDDGGTASGGVDTLSESLTVTVGAVNDQPVRTAGTVNNLAVAEDSGLTSLGLGGLTYGVGGGGDEAGQTLTYTVTSVPAASLGQIVLADGLTAVSASSTYTLAQLRGMQFLAAANATGGPATFGWTIVDDGGTANGGVDTLSESLTVTVGAVNDQPVRTAGTVNNLAVAEDSGLTSLGLAGLTYGVGGGADEAGQSLTYTVTSIPAASLGTIVLADGVTAVSASSTYTLAQLRGMQFLAAANATGGPATFGWTIVDDGGTASGGVDTLSESLTVTVGAVNDQPVRTAGTVNNLAVAEDSGLTSLGLAGLTYGVGGGADEAGQSLTYTVTSIPAASLGTIVLADGVTAVSASSTYTLAQLRGMQFLAAANATGGPATFGWTIVDDGGTASGGVDTLSESLTVTVGAVNDQPVRTAGTVNNLTVLEDSGLTSLGLGGLTYGVGGGADEAGQTLTYTVTSIPAASLGTIVLADGLTAVSASSTYTLAQLRGMQFLAAANATGGPATFGWTIVDDGGTASGGVDTLSESLTVTVGAVNDQPVRTAGTVNNLAVLEDSGTTSLGLGGLTYGVGGGADEAGQTLTYTVTSVPAASLGTIVLADGVTAVSASSTYTLAQLRGMQFLAAANATGGPATFGWTIADDGGTANGGVDTLSESLTVTVGAVNDPPVRTAGTVNNLAVLEDSGLTSLGLGGLTYGVGGGADEAGQTLTYTVTSIPAASLGTIVLADGVTAVSASSTYTLAQLRGMQFLAAANATGGPATFGWTIVDDGGTASGGVDTLAESLTVSVGAVNDQPVRTAGTVNNLAVAEDSGLTSLGLGGLTYGVGGGADEAGQTLTYTVTSVPAASLGTIVLADGVTAVSASSAYTLAQLRGMQFLAAANATGGPATFGWTIVDDGGTANGGVDTLSESLTVSVGAVNDQPVRTAGTVNNLAVAEDSGLTSLGLGGLTYGVGGGADEAGQTLTYTVTSIPAASLGTIVLADGVTAVSASSTYTLAQLRGMQFLAAANATGGPATFGWTIVDDGGTANGGVDTLSESLTVTVGAVNDQPVRTAGTVADLAVAEDSGLTSLGLGGLTYGVGGGADEAGQTLTYTVTSIPAASLGTIVLADGVTAVSASSAYTLAQLRGMQFLAAANATGGPATFGWTIADDGGTANGGVDTLAESLTISVGAVNDQPVRTAGTVADLVVDEDSGLTSLGLDGLTYGVGGGADEAGQTLTYTVTSIPAASLGQIVLADGLTAVSASSAYTLAQLRGMQFLAAANATGGPATFGWTIADDGGTASGGVDTLSESLTVSVGAVNDQPVRTAGTVNNLAVAEDSGLTSLGLGGLTYGVGGGADEAGQTLTYTVTSIPAASLGTIVLADGLTAVSASSTYTLAQLRGMQFLAAANATGGPATFGWTIADDGGTASGGVDTLSESLTVTVGAVNDQPARLAGTVNNLAVLEDSGLTSLGLGGLTYGVGGGADEAGQTLTYTVTSIPAASLGTIVLADGVTAVSASSAYTLAQLRGMQFLAAANATGGPATFGWTIVDDGGTANGGVDTLSESLTISVGAVNDQPVRTAGTVSNLAVAEDSGLTSLGLGGLTYGVGGGGDEAGQTLTYTVTSIPAASLGTIVLADGLTAVSASSTYTLAQLRGMQFLAAANATGGPATFSWTIVDDGGTANGGVDTLSESLTVTVGAVNDQPVRTAGTVNNLAVLEDSGLTSLGLAGLTYGVGGGADEAGQTLTYTVTSVPAASLGQIVLADGVTAVSASSTYTLAQLRGMQFLAAANATGGPATFGWTIVDDGGTASGGVDTLSESLTVSVGAVNDQPVRTAGTVSNLAVAEDSGLTSLGLGGLTYGVGGGADEAGQTLTYTVTSIPAASLGTIVLADGLTAVSASSTYTLAQLRGMQFLAAANATGGPATFGWTIVDDGGTASGGVDTLAESLTVTVGAVNDQPARLAGTVNNLAVAEDSGLTSLGLGGLTYGVGGGADEAGQTLTYTVTSIPATSLGTIVLADGLTAVSASSTYTLAQLRGMQFLAAANATGGPATFGWTIVDDGGTANGGVDTLSESLTVTVGAVNDQPVRTAGTVSNLAVLEDSGLTSLGLGGLTYGVGGGADEAGQTLTYTVTSIPATSLGTIVLADGLTAVSASSAYTLAQLRGMQFLAAANATGGPATFGWTIVDDGGTANGGVDTLSESLTVTVGAVNDQPVRTAGTVNNLAVAEDSGLTSLGLGGLIYGVGGGADEAGQTLTYTVTSIPAASLGTIVLADGLTAVSASSTYTLAQLRGMQFLAAANATGGPATFSWTIVDDGGTANGGVDTLSESLTVTVGAVNDQPVRTAGTVNNLAVLEDSGLTSLGLGGLTYGVGGGGDEAGQTLTYTVTSIPAASLGTIVLADGVTAVSASSTYTLAQLRGMQFLAAANATGGPATFGWTIADDGGTASGGVDTLSESLTVTVGAVNDQPARLAGTVSNLAVAEDSGLTSLGLGGLTYGVGGGADEAGQTLTYTVTSIPAASLGTIVLADGVTAVSASSAYTLAQLRGMQFLAAANATGGPATFGWTIVDDGGTANGGVDTLSESLTISVGAVNDQPVRTAGTVSNLAVAEDSGLTSLGLGGLTYGVGGGGDEAGQTLTYTVTSIPAASLGTIVLADGLTAVSASSTYTLAQLRGMQFLAAANATGGPATFSWTIVDDGGTANGGVDTLSESLTVTVGAVNDQPVRTAGTVSNLAVAEDSGLTSLGLGGLTYGVGGGGDEAGQTLTYTVTSIPAASLGQIVLADGLTAVSASSTYTLAQLRGMQFLAAANATGGPATFGWTIADDGGTANGGVDTLSESLTVTVGAVNDQPVRTAGTVNNLAVAEDSGLTSLGLGGLTYGVGGGADEAGQTLTYMVTSIPAASLGTIVLADGVTAVSASSTYTLAQLRGMQFLAAANATGGPATFGWTIVDDGGTANGGVDTLSESLTVTVGAVNDQPVRTAGTVNNLAVAEDSGLTSLGLGGLTYGVGGGADEAGQTLTYTVTSIPAASLGTIVLADGVTAVSASSTYTLAELRGMQFLAAANATGGPATFSWTIVDDGGTASGGVDTLSESLTVSVGAVNDQPVRTAGTVNNLAVAEDSGLTSLGLGGLTYGVGGGADEAGQTLTYTVTSIPAASLGQIVLADGLTAVSASSTYTLAQLRGMQFLAAANATGGPATFGWTIVDDGGTASGGVDTLSESLTISVGAVNDVPIAADDSFFVSEGGTLVIAANGGLLSNDSDVEGDALTASMVSGPAHGLVFINGDGSFTYTPDANFNGVDLFTYHVTDGTGTSNTATVSIVVNSLNDAPQTADLAFTADNLSPLVVAAPGVLGSAFDVDGDPLTAVLLSGPDRGTLHWNDNGSFTYEPDINFAGVVSFQYYVTDGVASSNVATVEIIVQAIAGPPNPISVPSSIPATLPLAFPADEVKAIDPSPIQPLQNATSEQSSQPHHGPNTSVKQAATPVSQTGFAFALPPALQATLDVSIPLVDTAIHARDARPIVFGPAGWSKGLAAVTPIGNVFTVDFPSHQMRLWQNAPVNDAGDGIRTHEQMLQHVNDASEAVSIALGVSYVVGALHSVSMVANPLLALPCWMALDPTSALLGLAEEDEEIEAIAT